MKKIFRFIICGRHQFEGNLSLPPYDGSGIYKVGILRSIFIDWWYGEDAHWASHPIARWIEKMEKTRKEKIKKI